LKWLVTVAQLRIRVTGIKEFEGGTMENAEKSGWEELQRPPLRRI
jgi:hypothetical protein